jgi:hypothetical protein
MVKWVLRLTASWLIFRNLLRVSNLPGNLGGKSGDGHISLKTHSDLFAEFGSRLPPWVYDTFDNAVWHQSCGDIVAAEIEYDKLRHIQTGEGDTFNLTSVSDTIRHNLGRLR